jgi:hypothetical protein
MGAGVAIGLLAASHSSVGAPGRTVTTAISSSAQWAAEGAQLVRDTGRNWAYESEPVDITGNGTYFLDFGPVPPSFNYPSNPTGISFDWPSDSHFSEVPTTRPRTVTLGGKRYLQIGFSVFQLSSPYRGYRAWIY